MVGAFADFDAALEGVGLPHLVEGHHHDRGTVAADFSGVTEEDVFALFQGNRVDDALALAALQGGADDFPLGGVDHEGDAGHVRFAGEKVDKMAHLFDRLQESVVEIDVDHEGAVFHLSAGDAHGFVVFFLVDEPQETP